MRHLTLRERLNAATTHPVAANESTDPVEYSVRSLSNDEEQHVNEVMSDLGVSTEAATLSNDELNEMFGSLLDTPVNNDELLIEEDKEDDEDNNEEEEDEEDEEPDDTSSAPTVVSPQQVEQPQQPQSSDIIRAFNDIHLEVTSRFSGASWYDSIHQKNVTIVGVGGIGSWTALLMSRLNVASITLYDGDVVESGNMSGQFFSDSSIDTFKVDAVFYGIRNYSRYLSVTGVNSNFDSNTPGTPIMISCLDSMSARRTVFEAWKRCVSVSEHKDECLFIDGRLSAEVMQVFAVQGDDTYNIQRYENTLFRDSEADSEVCSYKQTSFMANMIASVITNVFVNFVASKLDGGAIRSIPFKTEYLGDVMYLKTEL